MLSKIRLLKVVDGVAYAECVINNVVQLRKFVREPTRNDDSRLY